MSIIYTSAMHNCAGMRSGIYKIVTGLILGTFYLSINKIPSKFIENNINIIIFIFLKFGSITLSLFIQDKYTDLWNGKFIMYNNIISLYISLNSEFCYC